MDALKAKMFKNAHDALGFSYSPYSHFPVACCIATDSDALFTGVNVENAAYGLAFCAEASAIAQMVSAGHTRIKSILVMGETTFCPPCGACRQRLSEFSVSDTEVLLCDKEKIHHTTTMGDLFPMAFSSAYLTGNSHD